jgi:hypothetical protein
MPLGYPQAFGLSDNPFGPRQKVGALPPASTADLQTKPLLVHRTKGLDTLYCDNLPSFLKACKELDAALNADGYTTDPMARGTSHYFIAVEGDRGAGKTTLASRMIQLMARRLPDGDPPWAVRELMLKSDRETATEQIERIKTFDATLQAVNDPYVCLLIDDVVAEAYPQIAKLYEQLQERFIVFLVMTTCDPAMGAKLDQAVYSVRRYPMPPFTPDDAVAYITSRYSVFQLPAAKSIAGEPMFPFTEADIRSAVTVRKAALQAEKRPLNMRMIASFLQFSLSKRLETLAGEAPGFDLGGVPASKLKELMIQLTDAYDEAMKP